jgi:hypothetical protein
MDPLRKLIIFVISLGSLLLLSPAALTAYKYSGDTLLATTYPSDGHILMPVTQADLNGDGQLEDISITGNQVQITSSGQVVWQSPSGWQVKQAFSSDLNQDGQLEVALLIIRPFQPWPVDQWLPYGGRINGFQDQSGQSCHIILIGWRQNHYKEVWAGSSLSEPALEIGAADFNLDGKMELLTLEGNYNDPQTIPAHEIKLWEWNGFGFSLLSKLPGRFDQFLIIQTQSGPVSTLILAY